MSEQGNKTTRRRPAQNPIDLLSLIDSMVRSDQGPPTFSGCVAMCLRRAGELRWWQGSFGKEVRCGFVASMPTQADVMVGLGSLEMEALLGLRAMPSDPNVAVCGDMSLFVRFVKRYVAGSDAISLRCGPVGV